MLGSCYFVGGKVYLETFYEHFFKNTHLYGACTFFKELRWTVASAFLVNIADK